MTHPASGSTPARSGTAPRTLHDGVTRARARAKKASPKSIERGRASEAKGAVFARVYAWVRKVPRGKVVTYGQLSELIDRRLTPLAVGWALSSAPPGLPWHRVVNARGAISAHGQPTKQRALLEAEGVRFDAGGRVDLATYGWRPRARARKGGATRP